MNYKEIEIIILLVGLSIASIPIFFAILKHMLKHIYLPFIYDGSKLYAINPLNNRKLCLLDYSRTDVKNKKGKILTFSDAFNNYRWLPCNGIKINLNSLLCKNNGTRILYITKFFMIEFYRKYYD